MKIKKNVQYEFFNSCFSLGSYTKVFLYEEKEFLSIKNKEKKDFLFLIYNEVSLSIVKDDDKLSRKTFMIIENDTKMEDKNNFLEVINNLDSVPTLINKSENTILCNLSPAKDETMIESGGKNRKEYDIIDITSCENEKKKNQEK